MANEMLTGMLSKPKGPAAPGTTQNSYGGTVPSPVAQPPQTPGFQNNTANPQWWGGKGGGTAPMGATSGYGSSTPTPYTPPSDDTVDDTATEATGTTTGTPPAGPPLGSTTQEKVKKQGLIQAVRNAQSTLLQRQQELAGWQQAYAQSPTIRNGHGVRNAQQQILRAQNALQDWQRKLTELGY